MIAALLLHPFPLWLAGREHGHDLPLAVTDAGKILHANPQAQAGGVQEGMRVSGALSRLPDLHTVPLSGPALEAAWAEVATTLPIYSPKVESLSLGRALLARFEAEGWARRDPASRAVRFSPDGRRRFDALFPA